MAKQKAVNVWEMSDLSTPWSVHVAATLRIADHIAAGTDRIEDLARTTGCDPYALHSLLGFLVAKGLFEEPEPGRFALNEPARQLLDPTTRVSLDLEDLGGRMAYAWTTLLKYVRTGASAYQDVFGLPFFEDLNANPKIAASFDALIGPQGHGIPSPDITISGGWDSVRTVVDVGGGTGALLAEILKTHPHLSGILVDQPETVQRSAEIFQAAGVAGRVSEVGQSFFDPLPSGADLYLLKGILNDWPDREALAILRRCAEAAGASGRVIVLGGILPEGSPKILTIEMVLLGGKHRTVSEFRELAREAGLQVTSAAQQPVYFVVECRSI
jgi:2,7-dihydroxy-5-methyl-1-naphthoate 7-O-methyltransferase